MSELLAAVLANEDSVLNPGWADRRGDKENLGHYVTKEEANHAYKTLIKTKKDYLGATPLHKAARKGDAHKVLSLLDEGCDIEGQTRTGYTPLHYSSMMGQTEVCRLILERAEVLGKYHLLSKKNKNGWTPLHSACENNRVDTAILLIEFGADLHVMDHKKRKPLDLARISRLPQIQEKVTNAILHYSKWNRRKGFVYLLCLLKDAQDTYHESWKALVPTAFENSPSRRKSKQSITTNANNNNQETLLRTYSPSRRNETRVPTSPPRVAGVPYQTKEHFSPTAMKRERIGLKRVPIVNMKEGRECGNHRSDAVSPPPPFSSTSSSVGYTYDVESGKRVPLGSKERGRSSSVNRHTQASSDRSRGPRRKGATRARSSDSVRRSTDGALRGSVLRTGVKDGTVAAKYEYVVPEFHDHHINNGMDPGEGCWKHHLIHNPTDLYFQAKIRGIEAENLHRYQCAGYMDGIEYARIGPPRYGGTSLQLWDSCRAEGETVDPITETGTALEKLNFYQQHIHVEAKQAGYSEKAFLRILKTKHRNTRLRSGGTFNWQYSRYYGYGIDDLNAHKARNTVTLMRQRLYRTDRNDVHRACWQEMQNLDHRRHVEYRLVRRIRSRYSGHYMYFREDKEFLLYDKGVDPGLQLMAFCLLREEVYRTICSYL